MNELMKAVIFGVYLFGVLLVLDSILFSKQNTLKKRLDRIQAMGNPGEELLREEPVQKKQFRRPAWFDVSGRLKKELDGAGIALNPVEFIAIWRVYCHRQCLNCSRMSCGGSSDSDTGGKGYKKETPESILGSAGGHVNDSG